MLFFHIKRKHLLNSKLFKFMNSYKGEKKEISQFIWRDKLIKYKMLKQKYLVLKFCRNLDYYTQNCLFIRKI